VGEREKEKPAALTSAESEGVSKMAERGRPPKHGVQPGWMFQRMVAALSSHDVQERLSRSAIPAFFKLAIA